MLIISIHFNATTSTGGFSREPCVKSYNTKLYNAIKINLLARYIISNSQYMQSRHVVKLNGI